MEGFNKGSLEEVLQEDTIELDAPLIISDQQNNDEFELQRVGTNTTFIKAEDEINEEELKVIELVVEEIVFSDETYSTIQDMKKDYTRPII